MKDTILIYSGGLDSTVLLHKYKERISVALSFDYGSNHAKRELECAKKNCQKLGIEHIIIPLDFMAQYFESSLLKGGKEIPDGHYEDETMKSTVVPFRNGIMMSIAVGLAESRNIPCVYIGAHSGDHAIYPDCRTSFLAPFYKAAKEGTYNNVQVIAPFDSYTKREIAQEGNQLKTLNFAETYSCYKGGENHCGTCGTCTERKEALEGFDNTKYDV